MRDSSLHDVAGYTRHAVLFWTNDLDQSWSDLLGISARQMVH